MLSLTSIASSAAVHMPLALAAEGGAASGGGTSVLELFRQSFDVFTVLLVLGSLAAGTVIVRAIIEIRASRITPEDSERQLRRLLSDGNLDGVESFVQRDTSFYSHVLRAGLAAPASGGSDRAAIRNASELAASEQCARWFRIIEPLNVIGNLGPLLGLAGTVWGMIIAFNVLSASQGEASSTQLSGGIAKALFHTLLGLVVAIPALLVFGLYRTLVDRLCTRAMTVSAEMVEMLCDLRSR